MEKIDLNPKAKESPVVERMMDGDVYNISFQSNEALETTIKKIAAAFGEPSFMYREIIETIKNGKDWRFEGTFNLKLQKDKLFFDNRNGRGVLANRQKMKEIMDSI